MHLSMSCSGSLVSLCPFHPFSQLHFVFRPFLNRLHRKHKFLRLLASFTFHLIQMPYFLVSFGVCVCFTANKL